ncbi:hypothetical protein ACWGMK_13970 [Agrobacterium deltaense]
MPPVNGDGADRQNHKRGAPSARHEARKKIASEMIGSQQTLRRHTGMAG